MQPHRMAFPCIQVRLGVLGRRLGSHQDEFVIYTPPIKVGVLSTFMIKNGPGWARFMFKYWNQLIQTDFLPDL